MEEEFVEEILAEEEAPPGLFEYGGAFLLSYGWWLVGALFFSYAAWTRLLQPRLQNWLQRRRDDQESAVYHKDPDVALARMQAMEAARARMQAAHDVMAAEHARKLQEQEEQKRLSKIADWEQHEKGLGYRNKMRAPQDEPTASQSAATKIKPKPRLRNNDYNPLMGSSSSDRCFRSSRPGGASGGG